MSSPSRVFAILELFTPVRPLWSADEINQELEYSRPTGYRYVKELVDAGFLQKVSAGRYALGGRIVTLDYIQRQTDPVYVAAAPIMQHLSDESGFDAVLSRMFGGHIVDTHRVHDSSSLRLAYGRGRVRPLFQGAAAKVLISQLPRQQLTRLYETNKVEAQAAGLGNTLTEFRTRLSHIRRQGFYFSLGELEPSVGGAAVPIISPDKGLTGALALVGTIPALKAAGEDQLRSWLEAAAVLIQARFDKPTS